MANTFDRKTQRSIGTSATAIESYSPASGIATVIGLSLSNRISSQVLVDVVFNDGTNSTYMIKSAPIPVGGSLVVVGGDQKVVMKPTDTIEVTSDTAASVDAVMSVLEIT